MSDQSSVSSATAATVLLAVCLLVAAAAPGAVAGSIVADGYGPVESEGSGSVGSGAVDATDGAVASTDSAVVTSDSTPESDSLAPDLRSANGTVEVVVRFAGDARLGTNDDGGGEGDEAVESSGSATLSTSDLKTNAATEQADFETFADRRPGVAIERRFWLANAMLVTVDTDSVAVDRLLDVRGVERVHENFEVELDSATPAPADGQRVIEASGPSPASTPEAVSTTSTGSNATYGVEMVRAPEVWETFRTRGDGVTIAVLDTGIDPDHPDLNVSGWAEYDANGNLVSDDVSDASDPDGHGTHVAGTVAGGNASGTAIGVAPEASLYGIKVFDDDGDDATFAQVIAGMEHATEASDVDVLQMSLGVNRYVADFIEPVRNARNAGKIVVVSSGNDGQGTSSSPGNVYDSLAVGAVDANRDVASTSSGETIDTSSAWGSDAPADWPETYVVPDVSAPGVSVKSSLPGGTYGDKSGTSMAAPHVSGVTALMLSATSRNVSDDELYDTLRETANHPDNATDPDTGYGTGIVDGFAAVSSTEPYYGVSDLTAQPIVAQNATLNTTANVTNPDPITGENRTVELRLTNTTDGTEITLDETNLSLGAGNTTAVTLNGTVPEQFPTGETTVTVASPDNNETASIRIADAVGTINGTVTDAETNESLPEVDVVVRNGTVVVGETTTEADGAYAVDVPAADLTVTASNTTYAPANESVTLTASGETATANLSLALRNGTLSGVVNASDGLAPPSNATVTLANETGEEVATVNAAGDGSYAAALRPGTYNATADAPDFENRTVTGLVVSPNATTRANVSLTPRPASLSGTVTNATDGEAVPNATVTVGGTRTATTDANGTYALGALDRGERNVTVSAAGYGQERKTLTLAANDTRELNVSLGPRGVFVITDLSGDDEIEQGSSGSFEVTVRNDGRATEDASVAIALNRSDSGSATPNPVVLDSVAVGDSESSSFTVSIGSGAETGTYAMTATTPDSKLTDTFVAVSVDDGSVSSRDGSDDGTVGGPAPQPSPPAENTDDGPANETSDPTNLTQGPMNGTQDPTNGTQDPTNGTDGPTNQTGDLMNGTDTPTNRTDDPVNGTDDPTGGEDGSIDGSQSGDDEPAGDDEAGTEDGGDDEGGGSTGQGSEDGSTDGAPGFGPAVGVVAALAAAFLAGRRGGRGGHGGRRGRGGRE